MAWWWWWVVLAAWVGSWITLFLWMNHLHRKRQLTIIATLNRAICLIEDMHHDRDRAQEDGDDSLAEGQGKHRDGELR